MGNPYVNPNIEFLDDDGIIANHVLTSFSDDIQGKQHIRGATREAYAGTDTQ